MSPRACKMAPERNNSVGTQTSDGLEKRCKWENTTIGSKNPWARASRRTKNFQGNHFSENIFFDQTPVVSYSMLRFGVQFYFGSKRFSLKAPLKAQPPPKESFPGWTEFPFPPTNPLLLPEGLNCLPPSPLLLRGLGVFFITEISIS